MRKRTTQEEIEQLKVAYETDPEFKQSIDETATVLGRLLFYVTNELKLLDPTAKISDPNLPTDLLSKAIDNALHKYSPSIYDGEDESDGERNEKPPAPRVETQAIIALKAAFPIDKATSTFVKYGEELSTEEKGMTIRTFDGAPAEKGKPAIPPAFVELTYQLDQEAINTVHGKGYTMQTGNIDWQDIKLCVATAAIMNEKAEKGLPPYMSPNEIYKNMTKSKGHTAAAQQKKILDMIKKQMFTRIRIDTQNEQHLEHHSQSYTGAFLPCEIIEENTFINNSPTKALIHMFREPPLITFAKERGQFSTIDGDIITESPLSLTDENAGIECYLIQRIAWMKRNKKLKRSILIKTLLSECCKPVVSKKKAIQDAKKEKLLAQKKQWDREQRTLKNALRFIEHLKAKKYIKSYNVENERIEIVL